MKKAVRLHLGGTVQSMFFRNFVKQNAEIYNVNGFFRKLEDGRVEIFLEGNSDEVDKVADLCKKGPKYAQIRTVVEKEDHLQDFKEFRIISF
jgi:acylphosphatase